MDTTLYNLWLSTDHLYDPHGSAMEMLFIIAGHVWIWDPNVPADWGFSVPSTGIPAEDQESWQEIAAIFPALQSDRNYDAATQAAIDELVAFGDLLYRYISIARAKGTEMVKVAKSDTQQLTELRRMLNRAYVNASRGSSNAYARAAQISRRTLLEELLWKDAILSGLTVSCFDEFSEALYESAQGTLQAEYERDMDF